MMRENQADFDFRARARANERVFIRQLRDACKLQRKSIMCLEVFQDVKSGQ
jgi:hypothetical protein